MIFQLFYAYALLSNPITVSNEPLLNSNGALVKASISNELHLQLMRRWLKATFPIEPKPVA
jgi:hypothetical protein